MVGDLAANLTELGRDIIKTPQSVPAIPIGSTEKSR